MIRQLTAALVVSSEQAGRTHPASSSESRFPPFLLLRPLSTSNCLERLERLERLGTKDAARRTLRLPTSTDSILLQAPVRLLLHERHVGFRGDHLGYTEGVREGCTA
ncbi:hypothetical protein ASPACDRAFT_75922, partial [Aspergillus aculeatus ATCC 16872]